MSARRLLDVLRREWPYEPGWYTLNEDGYMCCGEACVRRDAPPMKNLDIAYIGAGVGEIYCKACQFERRRRPS